MIAIGKIQQEHGDGLARISSKLRIDGKSDFELVLEVDEKYGQYLVTERADAFLFGVLMYALVNGHDISCEAPVSSSLLFMLERQLIPILVKYESRFHPVTISCETVDGAMPNEGAVGTGISLGVDSFDVIAEAYRARSKEMRLTHLCTFNNGAYGGYFQNNNWDFCARKLYEKIGSVSKALDLPLVRINSNLAKLVRLRTDWYLTYFTVFHIMSLGKLFGTYFVGSNGMDYAESFNLRETYHEDCTTYELLSLACVSVNGGTRFISGGGNRSRDEKLVQISKFPLGRENLVSCLMEHYNCMSCIKCKRNLVYMDACGLLDAFSNAYDIGYYRAHREEYIRWLCSELVNGLHGKMLEAAYRKIKAREPELIRKFEKSGAELMRERDEMYRQRNVYRSYAGLFRGALMNENFHEDMERFLDEKGMHDIVVYGKEEDAGFSLLDCLAKKGKIRIQCVVENQRKGMSYKYPHIPESTVQYPACDAVVISSVAAAETKRKKLSYFVNVPVVTLRELLDGCMGHE